MEIIIGLIIAAQVFTSIELVKSRLALKGCVDMIVSLIEIVGLQSQLNTAEQNLRTAKDIEAEFKKIIGDMQCGMAHINIYSKTFDIQPQDGMIDLVGIDRFQREAQDGQEMRKMR